MRHGHRFTLVAGSAIATVSLLCRAAAAGRPRLAAAGAARAAPPGRHAPRRRSGSTRSGTPPGSPKVAFAMLPATGQPGQLHRVRQARRGVPRPVEHGRRKLERGVRRGVRLDFTGLTAAGTLPDHDPARAGPPRSRPPFAIAPAASAVPPAGAQRGALLHLRAGRRGVRSTPCWTGSPPTSPTGHACVYARPALRQQRQPARHVPPDRRPGERVRRLVRRGRRVREVRLHRQLHRRAAAARRARLPRPLPDAGWPRPASGCAGWRSCGARPRRSSTSRSASATATRATRSRATTTSGSCRRPRTT